MRGSSDMVESEDAARWKQQATKSSHILLLLLVLGALCAMLLMSALAAGYTLGSINTVVFIVGWGGIWITQFIDSAIGRYSFSQVFCAKSTFIRANRFESMRFVAGVVQGLFCILIVLARSDQENSNVVFFLLFVIILLVPLIIRQADSVQLAQRISNGLSTTVRRVPGTVASHVLRGQGRFPDQCT
jgi:hypothetical protein